MRMIKVVLGVLIMAMVAASCSRPPSDSGSKNEQILKVEEGSSASAGDAVSATGADAGNSECKAKTDVPKVLIYSFHVTNRCASCIAIEEAVKQTLEANFKSEVNSGRIRLAILNVDDEANEKIAEKYQAFGSGLFVTRVFKGKEATTDFTGDGFKYARNKQEKFIELLKTRIQEYLK